MSGGCYTLLIDLDRDATVTFGAAGDRALEAGWYAYVGSALGPGGFARVERHRELARGDRDGGHWHVDALLGHAAASIDAVGRSPGMDAECAVADAMAGRPIDGIGATDCGCRAHLFFQSDREGLATVIEAVHDAVDGA